METNQSPEPGSKEAQDLEEAEFDAAWDRHYDSEDLYL